MLIEQQDTEKGIRFFVKGSLSGTVNSTIALFEKVSMTLEGNPAEILLDVSKVVYIDSMSIGLLVGVLLKCKEKNISFRIENPTKEVAQILETTQLKKVFPDLY